MTIPDPMANRFNYKTRSDPEKFESSFPMLKDALQHRFHPEMEFTEGTVVWDSDKKQLTFTFPVDYANDLFIAVSNYIFGFMEGRGF